jgi:SAM-dependent methyltransferase
MSEQLVTVIRGARWWPTVRRFVWPLMSGWPDEGRRIVQRPLLQSLLKRAGDDSGRLKHVLNAGAGEGLYSDLLLAIPGVEQLTEIDVSYGTHARRPHDTRQKIVAASLTAVPIADGAVDLILCSEVLEHITDDGCALDELRRVLAPGGWVLISVPTPPAVYDPAHVREGYTGDELARMLTARGLDVIETRFCMRYMFRLVLDLWRRHGRMSRGVICALAYLDRVCPLGLPMDVIILARLSPERARPMQGSAPVTDITVS